MRCKSIQTRYCAMSVKIIYLLILQRWMSLSSRLLFDTMPRSFQIEEPSLCITGNTIPPPLSPLQTLLPVRNFKFSCTSVLHVFVDYGLCLMSETTASEMVMLKVPSRMPLLYTFHAQELSVLNVLLEESAPLISI